MTQLIPDSGAVSLDRFPRNRCGVISVVEGDEDDVQQLQAMGVCRGRRVMVVQHGDPLIVRVLGSRIGMSARLAARVMALPDDGIPAATADRRVGR